MKRFIKSLNRIISNLFAGRVSLPKQYVGKVLNIDNQDYTIFRRLKVDLKKTETSIAVFKVNFKFRNLPTRINKYLSMIPVPFLIGLPGFREKYWTISEDGYFQGIYQWASEALANDYPNTFIFKVMTKRAVPGTVSYEVIPDTRISDYIKVLED